MPSRLTTVIVALERRYGRPKPPRITDPWEMILHENAAYLVDDERRDEVFESLRKNIGLRPTDLLKADRAAIAAAIERGGMQPDRRAQKLIDAAEILASDFDGDLRPVLTLPEPRARKALKLFPGVGDPSADRIFLHTRTHPFLAVDSNALRVLVRAGFGAESTSYAKTYKSVQGAVAPILSRDFDFLIAASQLLRQHGQELCRRTNPDCAACPLQATCPFVARR